MKTHEEMKQRFDELMERFKRIGFKGECLVNKEGVFIIAHDDFSSFLLKKATSLIKDPVAYYKPRGSRFSFFCYSTVGEAKKEVKKFAKSNVA